MRPLQRRLAFAVLIAPPCALPAQGSTAAAPPARFDLSRLRFGTVAEAGTISMGGRISGTGDNVLTSDDTVAVDAQTLRFGRSVTVRLDGDGRRCRERTRGTDAS